MRQKQFSHPTHSFHLLKQNKRKTLRQPLLIYFLKFTQPKENESKKIYRKKRKSLDKVQLKNSMKQKMFAEIRKLKFITKKKVFYFGKMEPKYV